MHPFFAWPLLLNDVTFVDPSTLLHVGFPRSHVLFKRENEHTKTHHSPVCSQCLAIMNALLGTIPLHLLLHECRSRTGGHEVHINSAFSR